MQNKFEDPLDFSSSNQNSTQKEENQVQEEGKKQQVNEELSSSSSLDEQELQRQIRQKLQQIQNNKSGQEIVPGNGKEKEEKYDSLKADDEQDNLYQNKISSSFGQDKLVSSVKRDNQDQSKFQQQSQELQNYQFKYSTFDKKQKQSYIDSLQKNKLDNEELQEEEEEEEEEAIKNVKLEEKEVNNKFDNLKDQEKSQEVGTPQLEEHNKGTFGREEMQQQSKSEKIISQRKPEQKETFEQIETRIKKIGENLTQNIFLLDEAQDSSKKSYSKKDLPSTKRQNVEQYDSSRKNLTYDQRKKEYIQKNQEQKILKNFEKFEQDAQLLNDRVLQIKRELEDESSSETDIQNTNQKTKQRQHAEKNSQIKYYQSIQQEQPKKIERNLIIKQLEREKQLVNEIQMLKGENKMLKQNNQELQRSYTKQKNENDFQCEQECLHQNMIESSNQKQQQPGSDIYQVKILEKQINEATTVRNIVADSMLSKLEKEIELYKIVERLGKKLKKSIQKKINDQKVIENERQRQKDLRKQQQSLRQNKLSKSPTKKYNNFASTYLQQNQLKHCENCAYLLNKGIPTSFCSCLKGQKF